MDNPINLLSKIPHEGDGIRVVPSSVRPVAVLFLSYGRNAWHSTWIRRYSEGDFSREGRVVERKVEARKGPGTVFYLKVLPAFQIDYSSRKFIVAEINTQEPFRHMDLSVARYPLFATNLTNFLALICPTSSLWKPGQRHENSVIVQEVEEDYIDLSAYKALSKGAGGLHNPPIGSYARQVSGQSWSWEAGNEHIALRWYNRALEALIESRERLADYLG